VDGQPYDTERWGQYFRPAGVNAPAGGSASAVSHDEDAPAPVVRAAPAVAASAFDDDEPAVASAPVSAPAAGANKAEDILAMIRARQKQ
jgi:hypothetical protein